MEKPLLIVEQEFQQKLVELANEYIPLVPARYMKMSVDNLLKGLEKLEESQLAEVRKAYEKSLEESEVESDG